MPHHRLPYFIITTITVATLVLGLKGHADIYTWTDPSGSRSFSNISPPDKALSFEMMLETDPGLQQSRTYSVTYVFDGDSVKLEGHGLTFVVRLAGIDAPETGRKGSPGQPFSRRSEALLQRLVKDRPVTLKTYGTGGYNRVLAELFTGPVNINLELIKAGMAEVYQGKFPESFPYSAYVEAETRARARKVGIWSLGSRYMSPKTWRKLHPRE